MRTKNIADKLLGLIQELTAFYAEISEELSENHLRIVVDNTRGNSELKKMSRKCLTFGAIRRHNKKNSPQSCGTPNKKRTAAELPPRRLSKKTLAAF